ncbi:hypothetical protein COW53_06565 [bacterium CG17_big_fil_post_rev_8_21_14_2_50_64_8]|nr:MAG: hypothetical protein COW53_06565 [bacterium CG17_big_fil_post_rev_8_21_14_2_50_64_8]PJA76263.1 MAG: hypothetical protein CO151_03285 [bacterium CG_4_9_14_3_um_filter_65_15]
MPAGIRKYLHWQKQGGSERSRLGEGAPDGGSPPPQVLEPLDGRKVRLPAPAQEVRVSSESLRNLAHELRSPLTALKSSLQLVADGEAGPLTSDQGRFLALALRNLERLDRMTTDLLDRERSRNGGMGLRVSSVDLSQVLRDGVRMHAVAAERAGLDFDLSGLPDSYTAEIDTDRLLRIVDNLLSNAVKFTAAPGLVRVWIDRGAAPVSGLAGELADSCGLSLEQFILVVEDSGRGIAPERQARLFEAFSRVHDENRLRIPGSGLGLHIVRDLVAEMGGALSLASRPGRGTTVWLRLPRNEETRRMVAAVQGMETRAVAWAPDESALQAAVLDLRDLAHDASLAELNGFLESMAQRRAGLADEVVPGLYLALIGQTREWYRAWSRLGFRLESGVARRSWETLGQRRVISRPQIAQLV